MTGLSFTPADYRGYIRYSHQRHILVEGADDKRVFELLLDESAEKNFLQIHRENIKIDTAEYLIDFQENGKKIGNREKVELICQSIFGKTYEKKFVGFVDREFREFEQIPILRDNVLGHRVLDRLVWSRGHSIENYFFDFDTLRKPLRSFSVTDNFHAALELFEQVFEQTIRIACAVSLAGNELEKIRVVQSSASREILEVVRNSKNSIKINQVTWISRFTNRLKLKPDDAGKIIERYLYWKNIVNSSEFSVVRWMCHGHIGLAFIWAAYSCCVFEVCRHVENLSEKDANKEAQRVLMAEESVRFNMCADLWVQRALGNHCEFPSAVFELLD